MAAAKKKSKKATPPRPGIRLLPILVGVAVLMLSVRIHDIWRGLSASVKVGAELEAEQPARGQGPQASAPAPQSAAVPPAGSTPAAPKAQSSAPAGSASDPHGAVDTETMSQSEMGVLEKLSDRRAQLDAREKQIEHREDLLKAAESQIDRKVAELKSLQGTIEGLLKQYNEQEDNKMRSLVKIYENMKPKEAAKIFEQLDMEILLDVVERMKEQKVAPILAEMDPSKARAVTSEIAQRRQIPLPQPAPGG